MHNDFSRAGAEGSGSFAVPDRIAFEQAIERYIAQFGIGLTAVSLVDLNGLSELLAQRGSDCAATYLDSAASRLYEVFHRDCFIGRVGTDTFGVIGSVDEVTHRRIEKIKARPFKIDSNGSVLSLPISISVARAEECESSGRAVLQAATLAMKLAKAKGLGGYVHYSRELGEQAVRHNLLMDKICGAVEGKEFFLAFQPQFDLVACRVVGVEALLRWRLPSGELIPPDTFLPVADQAGLAIELGYQVFNMALQTSQRLREQGYEGLRMAVNVSVPQFRDSELVDVIKNALVTYKCPPEDFELEITESVAGLGEVHLIDMLNEIRALGIGVAIDDFGTGYSSLAYADRLPVDRLKIDRSFVTSLESGRAESCIAKTIISMGQTLGLKVLAEGVETENQLLALKDYGCDEVQGYYFAKPMVEKDLVAWLLETQCVELQKRQGLK